MKASFQTNQIQPGNWIYKENQTTVDKHPPPHVLTSAETESRSFPATQPKAHTVSSQAQPNMQVKMPLHWLSATQPSYRLAHFDSTQLQTDEHVALEQSGIPVASTVLWTPLVACPC